MISIVTGRIIPRRPVVRGLRGSVMLGGAGLNRYERLALTCAADLLCYPEAALWDMLPHLRGYVNILAPEPAARLTAFMDLCDRHGLVAMQREHVRTFDMNEWFSQNLAWHKYGDHPNLGRAYAALNELFRDAGFDPEPGELPDALPRILAFLASAPDWAGAVILDAFGKEICTLCHRLEQAENVYALVLQAVCAVLRRHLHPPLELPAGGKSLPPACCASSQERRHTVLVVR